MRKIILMQIPLLLLFVPFHVNSKTYYWNDENSLQMEYKIDESYWKEEEIKESSLVSMDSSLYSSECGYLLIETYKVSDILEDYSNPEKIDYNIFNNNDFVKSIIKGFEDNGAEVKSYKIENYNEFKYLVINNIQEGMEYYTYITINNNNTLVINYAGEMNDGCFSKIDTILYTSHSYINNDISHTEDIIFVAFVLALLLMPILFTYEYSNNKRIKEIILKFIPEIIVVALGLMITIIPNINCTSIDGSSCSFFQHEKGILYVIGYNSITILGVLFAFKKAIKLKKENAYIQQKKGNEKNKSIKKIKEKDKYETFPKVITKEGKKNTNDNIFVCDNCGTLIKKNAKKCPGCGEYFD